MRNINLSEMFLRYLPCYLLLFLSVLNSLSAQVSSPVDSIGTDSMRLETEDERDRPLGDTTTVYYYYLNEGVLTHIDTALSGFEYPKHEWRSTSTVYTDLGHLGTALSPLLWQAKPNAGFRSGLDNFSPYRLKLDDIPYFSIGGKRPYTDLYYSQINMKNVLLRARFAHQATPYFYYSLHYGLLNYNGYFEGNRSRHQDIGLNLRYSKSKYSAYFTFINNANNQSENGGLQSTALSLINNLFLANEPVNLNTQTDGTPKHENRHQTICYRQFWYNAKIDSASGKNNARSAVGHQLLFENNRYKYFDKNPADDSSFYANFQTNNRGIRHFMLHQVLENELSFQQALGGTLEQAPIVVRAFLSHRWNRVFQEPDRFYVNNFAVGAELYDRLNGPLSYRADLKAMNSRLGIDFWLRGKMNLKIKDFLALGGNMIFQRYEPEQTARRLYVSQALIWDNSNMLKQTQELSLNANIAWPRFWGSFEFGNHTITKPIYFDSTATARQMPGTANIIQLRLKQDVHLWKFHLENDVVWQRILSGKAVYRLPELIFRHSLYFESKVFKTVKLRTGVNFRYMSSYSANAYYPILANFNLQNEQLLSFQPVADIFVSVKIWQLRFFVNAENLTYYLNGWQNYYTAPNYATANWFVRLGASWQLFD